MQLGKWDIFYIINKATRFEAMQLIRKEANLAIIKVIFNAFKLAWINTYLSLLNFIIYNYKTNFNFKKFQTLLRFIRNTFKLILMKIYYLISKVKRYYHLLRYAYEIIIK